MFDIVLGKGGAARCDGVSRRDFLRVGALGGLGLTLPAFLQGRALGARKSGGRAKSVILVYLGGGLSSPTPRPRSAVSITASPPTSPASRSAKSCRAWPRP
jgi:hypothetical protein